MYTLADLCDLTVKMLDLLSADIWQDTIDDYFRQFTELNDRIVRKSCQADGKSELYWKRCESESLKIEISDEALLARYFR